MTFSNANQRPHPSKPFAGLFLTLGIAVLASCSHAAPDVRSPGAQDAPSSPSPAESQASRTVVPASDSGDEDRASASPPASVEKSPATAAQQAGGTGIEWQEEDFDDEAQEYESKCLSVVKALGPEIPEGPSSLEKSIAGELNKLRVDPKGYATTWFLPRKDQYHPDLFPEKARLALSSPSLPSLDAAPGFWRFLKFLAVSEATGRQGDCQPAILRGLFGRAGLGSTVRVRGDFGPVEAALEFLYVHPEVLLDAKATHVSVACDEARDGRGKVCLMEIASGWEPKADAP